MQPVSTSPLVRKYTLRQFRALPEPKDGTKFELIAGVLYLTPPPDSLHHFSVSRLIRLFSNYLTRSRDQGELFVPRAALWTSTATYVEPDLFYLTVNSLKATDWNHPACADLVVEVISPGSAIYDRNTKSDTYAALGVTELWLVDPANGTVEVRNLNQAGNQYNAGLIFRRGQRVSSKVLPRFTPSVTEIFKR